MRTGNAKFYSSIEHLKSDLIKIAYGTDLVVQSISTELIATLSFEDHLPLLITSLTSENKHKEAFFLIKSLIDKVNNLIGSNLVRNSLELSKLIAFLIDLIKTHINIDTLIEISLGTSFSIINYLDYQEDESLPTIQPDFNSDVLNIKISEIDELDNTRKSLIIRFLGLDVTIGNFISRYGTRKQLSKGGFTYTDINHIATILNKYGIIFPREEPTNIESSTTSKKRKLTLEELIEMHPSTEDRLNIDINDLSFRSRVKNGLINNGYCKVLDLVDITSDVLLKIPSFGVTCLNEVIEKLNLLGVPHKLVVQKKKYIYL